MCHVQIVVTKYMLENEPLLKHTTMRVGGNARYFFDVKTLKELKDAVAFSKEKKLPFYVLGLGSNMLVSDDGYDGVIIKNSIDAGYIEYKNISKDDVLVIGGAGEDWDTLVKGTVFVGLYGLENLSYIPGTVGAAPVQNIGAYGTDVSKTIDWVEVYDTEIDEIVRLDNDECSFAYRNSVFKKAGGKKYIIVKVAFRLTKKGNLNTSYKDVEQYFLDNDVESPTLMDVRSAIIFIRKNKLPEIKDLGTAGSFFKNPIVDLDEYKELTKKYPEMPGFEVDDEHYKIPAAWLIDQVCHLKGDRDGDVGVYEKQALAIINYGSATTNDILKYVEKVRNVVREKTGIDLEMEVCTIQ